MVGPSNGVGCKQSNHFSRAESTGVGETIKNRGNSVSRLWDQAVGSGGSGIFASKKELEAGGTRAVGDTNGSRELDHVGSRDLGVSLDEGGDGFDTVTDTSVGAEVGLDGGEDDHGAISTSTGSLSSSPQSRGDGDGVVWYVILVFRVSLLDKG